MDLKMTPYRLNAKIKSNPSFVNRVKSWFGKLICGHKVLIEEYDPSFPTGFSKWRCSKCDKFAVQFRDLFKWIG